MPHHDLNYDNDPRVQAAQAGRWYRTTNEATMVLQVALFDDDGEEELVKLPFRFVTCDLCSGRGTHVNPSIDAGGITGEQFADDPDFADDYRGGVYDVTCYECGGKRVVPELDDGPTGKMTEEQTKQAAAFWRQEADREDDLAEERAERRMGA